MKLKKPDETSNLKVKATRSPIATLMIHIPSFMIFTLSDFKNMQKKRRKCTKLTETNAICVFFSITHSFSSGKVLTEKGFKRQPYFSRVDFDYRSIRALARQRRSEKRAMKRM